MNGLLPFASGSCFNDNGRKKNEPHPFTKAYPTAIGGIQTGQRPRLDMSSLPHEPRLSHCPNSVNYITHRRVEVNTRGLF